MIWQENYPQTWQNKNNQSVPKSGLDQSNISSDKSNHSSERTKGYPNRTNGRPDKTDLPKRPDKSSAKYGEFDVMDLSLEKKTISPPAEKVKKPTFPRKPATDVNREELPTFFYKKIYGYPKINFTKFYKFIDIFPNLI